MDAYGGSSFGLLISWFRVRVPGGSLSFPLLGRYPRARPATLAIRQCIARSDRMRPPQALRRLQRGIAAFGELVEVFVGTDSKDPAELRGNLKPVGGAIGATR